MGEKAHGHSLFYLTITNGRPLLVKMYTELDINLLGLMVPNAGFFIVEESNEVLDKKHQSKLPGINICNLTWLTYQAFAEKYGVVASDSSTCLKGGNPLLFSQVCLFYYVEM